VPPEAPSWLAAFEPELRQLKALALGMTLGTVREIVAAEVPPHAAEELRSVIDGITKKVGGEPMPSSDWDALTQKSAALTQEEERGISHESWHEPRW
jgi:hypothetical protein